MDHDVVQQRIYNMSSTADKTDQKPTIYRVNLDKLTSGSNMLKASRLHGDVDQELSEMFTQRVAELATLRRLASGLLETDENEVIDKEGKRKKRDKAQIDKIASLKTQI